MKRRSDRDRLDLPMIAGIARIVGGGSAFNQGSRENSFTAGGLKSWTAQVELKEVVAILADWSRARSGNESGGREAIE
jgi:hypothetical protein